jgi:hypothetical protein
MQEYRRTIPDGRDYHRVHLGELDEVNTGGSYAFPTLPAATRFAVKHEQIAAARGVDRVVLIIYPGGELVTDSRGRYWDGQQWRQVAAAEHNTTTRKETKPDEA